MKRLLVLLGMSLGCRAAEPASVAPVALAAGPLRVHMASHADGVLRIERSPGAFIEVRAVTVPHLAAHPDGDRRVVFEEDGLRIVHVAEVGRVEELRRAAHRTSLDYRVKLGPELRSLRVVDDYVEALDSRGVALLRTEPAFLVDARGVRRDLFPRVAPDGGEWSLSWNIDDAGLTYPLDIDPAWTVTTSLAKPRRDNTLHLLSSGKVLSVAGLGSTGNALSTVESWDPATGNWTAAGALQRPRAYDGACTLPNGKILVFGGLNTVGITDIENTAEIYDPATATSTLLPVAPVPMGQYGRCGIVGPSLALLAFDGESMLLDTTTKVWTEADYVQNRKGVALTVLASGKALVAGGQLLGSGTAISSAEVFDPATKAWTSVAPMRRPRARPEAVTLLTGKVLVAGGTGGESTAELYDPIANTWTLTPPMTGAHSYNGMMLLSNGRVLEVAGDTATGLSDRADLYDPVANTWSFAGKLLSPLDEFGFVALSGSRALIAGGNTGAPVATTQIFEQQANGKSCLGAGECTSGFCVDGACCEKSSCASGQTCGGSGAPGTCLKTDGAACANNAECGSAHCVDGVCCNTACDDVCGACNVADSVGKCSAVPAGDAPHGARGACPGDGACVARCGGIEKSKCTQFPSAPVICAPAACANGMESRARGCDGAGGCAMVEPRACAPYACGDTSCRTQCDADTDCVDGNTCDLVTRKCVIAATCEGDHAVKSPDGIVRDCAPFRCAAGRCRDACTDSSSCAPGFVCDVASTRCVVGSPGEGSSGGCALSPTPRSSGGLVALVMALGLLRRRSGRRRA